MKKNRKKIFSIIGLLFLTVALPLTSYIYLQKGLNYQIKRRAELQNLGQMPPYKGVNQSGDTITAEQFKNKAAILTFISMEAERDSLGRAWVKDLYTFFQDKSNIVFLNFEIDADNQEGDEEDNRNEEKALAEFIEVLRVKEAEFHHLKLKDFPTWIKGLNIPDYKTEGEFSSNYFALIDTSYIIRNFYDYREDSSMLHLVEHLHYIKPIEEEQEVIYEPENEK